MMNDSPARRVFIASELHVTAERNRGEAPACAPAVGGAEQLFAEADRKLLDSDAAPARNEIVAQLVDEHDERDDGQEAQYEWQERERHYQVSFGERSWERIETLAGLHEPRGTSLASAVRLNHGTRHVTGGLVGGQNIIKGFSRPNGAR